MAWLISVRLARQGVAVLVDAILGERGDEGRLSCRVSSKKHYPRGNPSSEWQFQKGSMFESLLFKHPPCGFPKRAGYQTTVFLERIILKPPSCPRASSNSKGCISYCKLCLYLQAPWPFENSITQRKELLQKGEGCRYPSWSRVSRAWRLACSQGSGKRRFSASASSHSPQLATRLAASGSPDRANRARELGPKLRQEAASRRTRLPQELQPPYQKQ